MRNLLSSLSLIILATLGISAQEVGIASYYDDSFHGRKTASGELYSKDKLTAAHRTLPYGTILKVTRLDNNKSVRVRINDRGPYLKGRIVDLSRKAAERLDIIHSGHAKVQIDVVGKGVVDEQESPSVRTEKPPSPPAESPASQPKVEDYAEDQIGIPKQPDVVVSSDKKEASSPPPSAESAARNRPPASTSSPTVVHSAPPPPAPARAGIKMRPVTDKNYSAFDLYKIQLMRPEKTGFGVQIASITNYENVLKRIAELQGKWFNNILLNIERGANGMPVYKLILGPFADRATAESYKQRLKKKKKISGFVVDLAE